MKIYPTITTTAGDHLQKLKEASRLGLKEVCFFPTAISSGERKKFYKLLEKTTIDHIPFIHIRDDFEEWELEYFIKKFHTKVFNCHSQLQNKLCHDLTKFKNKIFVENVKGFPYCQEDIGQFGGICIDFSHLEAIKIYRPFEYQRNIKFINSSFCGCAHISAIPKYLPFFPWITFFASTHFCRQLNEVDYLSKYKDYFPEIMAIELENSLEEQLKIIDYLEKILNRPEQQEG